jgi:hypothetical protein
VSQPALLPEPPRPVRSRRLVYRVIVTLDARPDAVVDGYALLRYPSGWPIYHRFTRAAANVQVHKLAEQGIRAVVQRGRIEWEVESGG